MFDFLANSFSSAFSLLTGSRRLTESNIEDALEKIRLSLLEADIAYEVVESFVTSLKQEVIGKKVVASIKPEEMLVKIVHDKLVEFLGGHTAKLFNLGAPTVVLMMGLQGSGKTTTIGKLAFYLKKQAEKQKKSIRILVASVDYYRPAAIKQLEIVAQQAGVHFFKSDATDPLTAAHDIFQEYKKGKYQVLFLDTAGRMHIDETMLKELQEIQKIVSPTHRVLVLDSMTGQESLNVAKMFEERIGFDGAILSKVDSDARCGAAFAFSYVLKKPVVFIGTGEKVENLDLFRPDRMAGRILGMGDVQTLSERIDETLKKSDQDEMNKRFLDNTFNLEDFLKQLEVMGRIGSLSSLMRYLPGMSSFNLDKTALEKGEFEMKMFKAIISSMTIKERKSPTIINSSRKKRIADGAGVSVRNVEDLLARFEQTKQFAKLLKKGGQSGNFFK